MLIVDDLKHTVASSKPVQAATGALRSLHLDTVDDEVRKVVGVVRTQAVGLPERVTSLAGHLAESAREQATATLSALGTQGRDLLGRGGRSAPVRPAEEADELLAGKPVTRRTVARTTRPVGDDAASASAAAAAPKQAAAKQAPAATKATATATKATKVTSTKVTATKAAGTKAAPAKPAAAKVVPAKRVAKTAAPGEAVAPVPPTAPVDELPPSLEDEHPTPLTAAQEIANAQAAQEAADRSDDGT